MSKAKIYVSKWSEMSSKNNGLLLWGNVGKGKTYFAACIANALVENGVSVRMTNFSAILNDLFYESDKNGVSDIALLDICMPGILGTELAKEIQKKGDGQTDIIFWTTSSEFAAYCFSCCFEDACRLVDKSARSALMKYGSYDKNCPPQNAEGSFML